MELPKGTQQVIILSGRISATQAMLMCDHDAFMTSKVGFELPCGTRGRIVTRWEQLQACRVAGTAVAIDHKTDYEYEARRVLHSRFPEEMIFTL